MQEAGKSLFLVFAPVIIFELYACQSIMQIKSTLEMLFFCGHFFNNHVHVYIDMYG